MKRRITVVLDDIVVKKLCVIQSKKRKEKRVAPYKRDSSFSRVLNNEQKFEIKDLIPNLFFY